MRSGLEEEEGKVIERERGRQGEKVEKRETGKEGGEKVMDSG